MALHFTVVSEADEANLSRMSLDSSKVINKGPLPQYISQFIITVSNPFY